MKEPLDKKNISINFKNTDSTNNQKDSCNRKREPFLNNKTENKFTTTMLINQSYDDKEDQVNSFFYINSTII